jgi:hypothetical protein
MNRIRSRPRTAVAGSLVGILLCSAAAAIPALNAANDLALVYKATTGATTHLILDVTGYFK